MGCKCIDCVILCISCGFVCRGAAGFSVSLLNPSRRLKDSPPCRGIGQTFRSRARKKKKKKEKKKEKGKKKRKKEEKKRRKKERKKKKKEKKKKGKKEREEKELFAAGVGLLAVRVEQFAGRPPTEKMEKRRILVTITWYAGTPPAQRGTPRAPYSAR